MTSLWHFKHRTNYVAWFVTFGALFAATGFYKIYPDHPLWLAWLFSPVMLIQGLASMDSQALGHIGLLLTILAGLLSTSWVLQSRRPRVFQRNRIVEFNHKLVASFSPPSFKPFNSRCFIPFN